jgi:hypothetical protein
MNDNTVYMGPPDDTLDDENVGRMGSRCQMVMWRFGRYLIRDNVSTVYQYSMVCALPAHEGGMYQGVVIMSIS